jgi:hypothetical protein
LTWACSQSLGCGVYVAYPDARALGPRRVNPALGVPVELQGPRNGVADLAYHCADIWLRVWILSSRIDIEAPSGSVEKAQIF